MHNKIFSLCKFMRLCYCDCFDDSYDINFLFACIDFLNCLPIVNYLCLNRRLARSRRRSIRK